MTDKEIVVVVGTRPGIIMMAPIIHELQRTNTPHYVIHTGQHYSAALDSELFEDLSLTEPAYHLSGIDKFNTHATKTGRMMEGCEAAFLERRPGIVIVNGDANTNLAAALAARKIHVPIAHSEAGERSYDWQMPEEHNRRIMDHISELLFPTNEKAKTILEGEKVTGEIFVTGNTIVDASNNHASLAREKSDSLKRFGVEKGQYILMTSHREENVDNPKKLAAILDGAEKVSEASGLRTLFLVHPRTENNLKKFGLMDRAQNLKGVSLLPALRYLDFMRLLIDAHAVLTDSGGVQQEAFIHKRPCVTMRENTEWVGTVEKGGNILSGALDGDKIAKCYQEVSTRENIDWSPIFGDGQAAKRIVQHCKDFISKS